jgi:hypothetical protein
VRHDALREQQSRLHLPSAAVVRQLQAAFNTATKRAPDADIEWVRQHFIHHAGASYFVTPNLYSVRKGDTDDEKKEELRALALNQLAGVMEDVKLIRVVTSRELQDFLKEESRESYSDLSSVRNKWRKEHKQAVAPQDEHKPIRNHSLLSKAERALDIAGWSEDSKRDIEVYRLVDTEGLTPLLSLLNDANLENGVTTAEAASLEAAERDKKPLAITHEPSKA